MPYPYQPRRRPAEPSLPAQSPADQVEGCPPHYWVIADRWMTCRKCLSRRRIGRDGRVEAPEVASGAEATEANSGAPALSASTTPDSSLPAAEEG